MKKIPSLFKRDFSLPDNPIFNSYELSLPATAIATRKFDGTAVRSYGGLIFIRFDAKHGKTPPVGFEPCENEPDPNTGHWPGWIPANFTLKSNRFLAEAIRYGEPPNGTYELCGPKINGNPEGFECHVLIPHGKETIEECPTTFNELREWLSTRDIEGIVWWDQGKPIAKIKKRDFGLSRKPV